MAIASASLQAAHGQTPSPSGPAKQVPREVAVELLRYASTEASQKKLVADLRELLSIAQVQAILKDQEGLAKTTAQIQSLMDEADAAEGRMLSREAWPSLAGTYAWADQLERARAFAAKVPADLRPADLAMMQARLGDVAKVDAIIAAMKPADRDIAYVRLGESLWLGDRATAEKMLKKAAEMEGKSPGSAAIGYARVGDFKTASTLADKNKFAWHSIAGEMEALQEFELARVAKARYLTLQLQDPASLQSVTLNDAFWFQVDLDLTQAAAGTAARMVKEATQAITENKEDWEYQVTSAATAAEAAARIGDEALAKSVLDAAAKIKVPEDRHPDAEGQLEGYTSAGRARRLLAEGKWKDAIDLADKIADDTWKEDALTELVKDALRRGDVETAIKLYAGIDEASIRQGDSLEWIGRALARLQATGAPLAGKPVDLMEWVRSLKEHEERAKAARVIVEELLRRGAVKS
jgi:hypothetical protein